MWVSYLFWNTFKTVSVIIIIIIPLFWEGGRLRVHNKHTTYFQYGLYIHVYKQKNNSVWIKVAKTVLSKYSQRF
jgi:hypothetical protein